MIRYKCTVAYDGSAYCGWQTQKNGHSIQEKIEEALAHITNGPVSVLAAGRTDAGVNAWGQVFHFDSELDMSERKLMGAINGFLPSDIHIRKVEKKDRLFHARYCVRTKQYDYRICFGEYSVFTRNYVYQCPYPLNIDAMKEAASYLVGTHDFTSFNSNPLKETPDQVRTIESIEFHTEGDILTISFLGRGFLRYMVRMMTAQLLEAGRGRIEPIEVKRILEAKSKTVSRRNAHPEGLTLAKIDYFETAALTPALAVREYLPEDTVPEGMDLHTLEEDFRTWKLPLHMILADRHTNEPYGSYELNETEGILTLTKGISAEDEQSLFEQLQAYQRKHSLPDNLVIRK